MGSLYRIIVTGGRSYDDAQAKVHVFSVLDEIHAEHGIEMVMHGACGWKLSDSRTHIRRFMRGADAMAHDWATEKMILVHPYPADWRTHGKGAGRSRNQAMVDVGADLVVAFPGGDGTANCVALAQKRSLTVRDERRLLL
jgi:hypothetical protein